MRAYDTIPKTCYFALYNTEIIDLSAMLGLVCCCLARMHRKTFNISIYMLFNTTYNTIMKTRIF